jgi:hypothetical protein
VLTGRRLGVVAVTAVAAGLVVVACGDVVETGPDATPGKGFTEVIVTSPPTTAGAATTVPGGSTERTTAPGDTTDTGDAAAGGNAGGAATTAPAAGGPVTTSADEPFATGDCLTWQQGAAQVHFQVVPCTQGHLVEVAGPADLSGAFSPAAAYPAAADLQAAVATVCASIVVAYLGGEPASDVEPGVIPPTTASWSQGDRVAWCTVGLTRQNDQRQSYTGRVADRGKATS